MKNEIVTIQWECDHLMLIDQRKLPHEEVYVKCNTYRDVAESIEKMVIRGAPAIGVAAAMGVALGIKASQAVDETGLQKEFQIIYRTLLKTRPTAINLRWALDRMAFLFHQEVQRKSMAEIKESLEKEAIRIYEDDISINRSMANQGKKFIREHSTLLTYCNTGTLATAGYGTALGVIRAAFEEGKKILVMVCETRPFLQGLRLTSWELYKLGIPQKIIADNMAATLMAQKKIDAVFVGADRIAANGDIANKIGTYMLSVLAHHHGIPFYVVAPTSTIDYHCPSGNKIPIEERNSDEVTHFGNIAVGLKTVSAYNPAFDITPAHYVTALVTEKGVVEPLSEASLQRFI